MMDLGGQDASFVAGGVGTKDESHLVLKAPGRDHPIVKPDARRGDMCSGDDGADLDLGNTLLQPENNMYKPI